MDYELVRTEMLEASRAHAAETLETAIEYLEKILAINLQTHADAGELAQAWQNSLIFLRGQLPKIRRTA